MYITAAMTLALSNFGMLDVTMVSTVANGRVKKEFREIIGHLIGGLYIRFSIQPQESFTAW